VDSITLITMFMTLGIVWGGFVIVLVLALKRERNKQKDENN
jgi:heme/copper-type cytochrome/quinol oxidase subunit 2